MDFLVNYCYLILGALSAVFIGIAELSKKHIFIPAGVGCVILSIIVGGIKEWQDYEASKVAATEQKRQQAELKILQHQLYNSQQFQQQAASAAETAQADLKWQIEKTQGQLTEAQLVAQKTQRELIGAQLIVQETQRSLETSQRTLERLKSGVTRVRKDLAIVLQTSESQGECNASIVDALSRLDQRIASLSSQDSQGEQIISSPQATLLESGPKTRQHSLDVEAPLAPTPSPSSNSSPGQKTPSRNSRVPAAPSNLTVE